MTEATFIPLPMAAYQLALTWSQAYQLILTRKLAAEKRGKNWWVELKDLERVRRERAA